MRLTNLVEETDELGEIYEYSAWFQDKKDYDEMSIMGVHTAIENALDRHLDLESYVTKQMPDVLMLCLDMQPEMFGLYKYQLQRKHLEALLSMMMDESECFLDCYTQEEMYECFCRLLIKSCDELLGCRK